LTTYAGEVVAVDSGGYGAFTITQSISIIAAPGVYAGITVFSGDGIDVNAGGFDSVVLRGLTINGVGGNNGIVFNSGGLLSIEGCSVTNVGSDGLNISVGADALVLINASVFSRNGNNGIRVLTNSGGTTTMNARDVRLERNSRALEADSGRIVFRDSSAISNSNAGFSAFFDAQLTLESCVVAHTTFYGILANNSSGAGYVVHISNCTVTNNGTGLEGLSTGTMATRSNNTIENNGTDIDGTVTTYTAK
jgi:hypothetical protein